MAPGLLKALLQAGRYFLNWQKGDPESATEHGRGYTGLIFFIGIVGLLWLYQSGIATPADFAFFTGALVAIDIFQFGTLIRLASVVDPVIGGMLGAIGLEALTKTVRGIGAISATIRYLNGILS